MVHEKLKALRQKTEMSVRMVASELGFETHSKYSYYESKRFKGPLPLKLAKQLAAMWEYLGVEPYEVLELAGMQRDNAISEYAASQALNHQPFIELRVFFPDTESLELMFVQMLTVMGKSELADKVVRGLALLLPTALKNTPTWKDDPDRTRVIDEKLLVELDKVWKRYHEELW